MTFDESFQSEKAHQPYKKNTPINLPSRCQPPKLEESPRDIDKHKCGLAIVIRMKLYVEFLSRRYASRPKTGHKRLRQNLKKRFYIVFVSRDEQGQLNKVP